MTELICYHRETNLLAAFESEGEYWVGSYSPFLTHQTDEPMYILIEGYFSKEEDAVLYLNSLDKSAF